MNPFRIIEWVLKLLLYVFVSAFMGVVLILLPIHAISTGEPWWVAFAGWLALLGFAATVIVCVVVYAYWEYLRDRWDAKR